MAPTFHFSYQDSTLAIKLQGNWLRDAEFPEHFDDEVLQQFKQNSELNKVSICMTEVSAWNSALLTMVLSLSELCDKKQTKFDVSQLPLEMVRLIKLSTKIPPRLGDAPPAKNTSFLHNVGSNTLASVKEVGEVIHFIRDAGVAFWAMLRGKAIYRSSDTWLIMQQTGAEAMPIVSLLNFLVGAILGYIGAMQLEKFGAEIFIGDMVGVAMTREIAAIITAIIMAGRSGAAFAAQLGTMKVNEEIDALKSMGISPMEFLVLPRMIGMMLMMPLLAVYANFMGILGGALVAYGMLNITFEQYIDVVIKSVGLNDVAAGVFMATVFGVIVAVVGCQKGMSCGKSAEAVGASTTAAVVTATVIIFISAAILTVLYGVMGI
ncbi:MlaE family ABC transporter permease [sulfur-oxidizing endosymbiont of Gigantopelta aegis]|uniref:MlaE family ABC transporter permease n=1 Tax=sulfur-oxidizing endosymbiont of Gigantopelta aegis TaxID=2794934 RepID=UPI0018DCE562|nr:ABC transporter permease [sulfur-oxidizing endosymbiont of Gigantopelta aegis]